MLDPVFSPAFAETYAKERSSRATDGAESSFREIIENSTKPVDEKTEEESGLSEAQRYMANNVKTLAMASLMMENDEEDEEEGSAGKAGKSRNEIAKISFSESGDMSDEGGGGSETEVVEMPDGSKVMILRTEISKGLYTTIKIPLGNGEEKLGHAAADEAADAEPA